MPSQDGWDSVCYGDWNFVVTAYFSNKVAYSYNGINWKITTKSAECERTNNCYGNGKFVTVSGGEVKYSEDGINWIQRTMPNND
jgi:hypothetical protein